MKVPVLGARDIWTIPVTGMADCVEVTGKEVGVGRGGCREQHGDVLVGGLEKDVGSRVLRWRKIDAYNMENVVVWVTDFEVEDIPL